MDTLFRLVSLQQQSEQSFNSTSRTSSSSRSSRQNNNHHHHHYQQEDEECFNFFMDEEDFSSSSSKHYYPPYHHHHQQQHQHQTTTTTPTTTTTNTSTPSTHHVLDSADFSFSPSHDLNFEFSGKWVTDILLESAHAIADKNSARLQQLMWMLNELGSPYGDTEQKLASYFLQALFSRMNDSGERCYRTLASASEKTCSFESTRKMVLKFQEFNVIHHAGDLCDLNLAELDVKDDEALAINCVGALHSITPASRRRDYVISSFRRLQPRIITVVEEEADLDGRAIVDLVACPPSDSIERRETATRWSGRLHSCGFSPIIFSDEVCDDVRALLRRYKEGWSMTQGGDAGIFLCWKEQPVVWASAWRP
ncbi:hypothetical protein D5086_014953 [Populus alba]|uniref:Uncharacterized protein n=1 Tax=Populus alba TaxID=43335 RepID=A0ACC4BZK5_POPAL